MKNLKFIILAMIASCWSFNSFSDTLEGEVSKINYENRTFIVANQHFSIAEYLKISLLGVKNAHLRFSSLVNGMQVRVVYAKAESAVTDVKAVVLLVH